MAGKFIIIEGGDGSGKSSVIEFLEERLTEDTLFTREPGGTPAAEDMRKVILGKYETPLDAFTLMLLLTASRREHTVKIIKPALAAGRHVLSSRYSASTYAYQVVAGGVSKEFFMTLDPLSRDGLEPDLWIFLDLDPAVGLARKKGYKAELDHFERQALPFHEAVRAGTKEYISSRPHAIIDAGRSKEEVFATVYDVIKKVL